ncbi:MAG: undecaprenyldiphospho-muramoylpentapeptide beta-N-acetylglucosaminyltransferase [Clostridia bacterium]|nr:undecaprenyldiphospho-muramoylpentapeptide beta-N-acetylglucosaminyltransferase [Clostridia bacterium]
MSKILFTGGGTAGHVTPNVALIRSLHETDPEHEISYIGSFEGIEKQIIEKLPYVTYYGIHSGKLRRYFSLENVKDFFRVLKGMKDAKKTVKKIGPDVLFSKGGYVSVPVVRACAKNKIPVICHESDITPGLANKMSSKYATCVCTTFPDTVSEIPGGKGLFTGTPIRKELFEGDAERARAELGFDNKPVILIMGGSIGSAVINEAIRTNLKEITDKFNVIHLCGKGKLSDDEAVTLNTSYRQFEFVSEQLPDYLALCDIIVSRAGANAIHEFLAINKPMLLIPLPLTASRGDQILNAASFEKRGYAAVLEEEKITPETLMKAISDLFDARAEYTERMKNAESVDGTEKILELIKSKL